MHFVSYFQSCMNYLMFTRIYISVVGSSDFKLNATKDTAISKSEYSQIHLVIITFDNDYRVSLAVQVESRN